MSLHTLRRSMLAHGVSFLVAARALAVLLLAPALTAQAPALGALHWLPGDTVTAPVYGNEQAPAIAAGGAGSLVVWADARTVPLGATANDAQSALDIYGLRLDAAGNPLDAVPFPIAASFGWQRDPQVAWNGENWLVAWEDQAPTQFFYETQIKAVRVSPQGQVLDATPITLFAPGDEVHLTANGSTWLAVSQSYDSQTFVGLVGRRIAADGTLLDADPVVLVAGSYFLLFYVQVAAANGEFLLTWQAINNQLAQRFDANLQPLGAQLAYPGLYQVRYLAGNGSGWFMAWNGNNGLRASPLRADGTLLITPDGAQVASGFDAYSNGYDVGWNGSQWIVAWLHTYDAVRLARVSTAGAVLDPGGVVLDPGDDDSVYGMKVAGGTPGAGVQVVWSDIRAVSNYPYDVRGRHVSDALVPAPESVLSVAQRAQLRPDLAAYPGGALAVFESRSSMDGTILAQRLSADGTPLDAEPVVVASGASLGPASATWNGRIFLIAWGDTDGIRARRMNADGSFIDPGSILVMPSGFSPDVAAVGETFLVIGLKIGLNIQYINVHAARIDGLTGQVLDPVPLTIAGSYSLQPRVIAAGDRWLATWEQHSTHDDPQAFVNTCFISTDGTHTAQASVYYTGGFPHVAFSGDEFLFVFRTGSLANANNDVAFRRMLPDGSMPDPSVLFGVVPGRQLYNSVAWNGIEFVAAWEDQRHQTTFYDGRTDVYAARVSAAGALLDVGAFGVETGQQPAARPVLAPVLGTPGAALLASSIMRHDPGTHAWRIGARLIGTTPLWSDLGHPLAGSTGVPFLAGDGALVAGTPVSSTLSGAKPLAPAALVMGLSPLEAPFKGGVLVPTPDVVITGLSTDASGGWLFTGTWPAGVPSGSALWMQAWITDAAGPAGFAASNGVTALTP